MKTETRTIVEITFTREELCEALTQYSTNQLRDKIGHIISKGRTPSYSIDVNEADNSALFRVSIID